MKIRIILCIVAALLGFSYQGLTQQAKNDLPRTEYSIVKRDANSRVWEKVTYKVTPSGQIVPAIQHFTELASGVCYRKNGEWVDSQEQINILADGSAAATNGQHQVYFPADIYNGVITVVTPDGLKLKSQPVGLSYGDGTNMVMIDELTNSIGQIINSNQVVYAHAFAGVDADLLYTYRKGGFEQDVVFRERPPTPESCGLDPAKSRLQMITEFVDSPAPVQSASPINPIDKLQDRSLGFGKIKMIQGKAFLERATNSKNKFKKIPIYKSWVKQDGRDFLIEEVSYSRISAQLAVLPLASVGAKNLIKLTSNKVGYQQFLPPPRLARAVTNFIQLAKNDNNQKPGVVLDYLEENTSTTNFTFQGDTTYWVDSSFYLYGKTTLEGGAIIKLDGSYGGAWVEIDQDGTIDCETTPYNPAIFTSVNDDSVGEGIGYNNTPSYQDDNLCLQLDATNVTLHDVHFSYAEQGICGAGSVNYYNIRNCQFFNVENVINAFDVALYNDLIGYSPDESAQIYADGNDEFLISGSLTGENITSDSGYGFVSGLTSGVSVDLTNCLITGQSISDDEFGNNVTFFTNFVAYLQSPSVPVYQVVGGGNYYLTNASPYRGVGTANIDAALLADLAQKTTWPPTVYVATNISSLQTLGITVPRDTNDSPDLGYHYDPLDYVFGGCNLYSNLTFTAGTMVGWFQTNISAILLYHGANLSFAGTATEPCVFVRYPLVQEDANSDWSGGSRESIDFMGGTPQPQFAARFTKFTIDNDLSTYMFVNTTSNGIASFSNCELYHGWTYAANRFAFTNCLFFRVGQFLTLSGFAYECCTFYEGGVQIYGAPYRGGNRLIENCSFDGAAFYSAMVGINATNTIFAHNAYNTNNPDWANYVFNDIISDGFDDGTFTNLPPIIGMADVMVTNYNWQTSWFGNYYLPSNSPLIRAGSTNANWLGLYHFTTQTNQMLEGTNVVDIGYHYVATDQFGNPLDSNDDGIPDYLEDANGNGLVDNGELPWYYSLASGLSATSGLLLYTPLK